ncbi:MAG: GTP-binding protein [Nitrospirota bacterium]
MKTTVVCGLLGAGKTTFIRNFVTGRTEKTVVLVNDFGKAGIDGEIFSAGGIESVELPSGCVCCTLKFDLITTIQRIVKQFSPGHLLIEPSGVASPSGVLEALESAGAGKATVIGIVDVTEFAELYGSGMYGSFFEDQVVNSDVILVNKIDLANEHVIAETERMISSINPRAILFRTVNAQLDVPLPDTSRPLPSRERDGVRGIKLERAENLRPVNREHFHFETVSIMINGASAVGVITSFFDDLATGMYGSVARAKALVNTTDGPYRFDCTYGIVDVVRFEKEITESRLVVIGEGLDKESLSQTMASCSTT